MEKEEKKEIEGVTEQWKGFLIGTEDDLEQPIIMSEGPIEIEEAPKQLGETEIVQEQSGDGTEGAPEIAAPSGQISDADGGQMEAEAVQEQLADAVEIVGETEQSGDPDAPSEQPSDTAEGVKETEAVLEQPGDTTEVVEEIDAAAEQSRDLVDGETTSAPEQLSDTTEGVEKTEAAPEQPGDTPEVVEETEATPEQSRDLVDGETEAAPKQSSDAAEAVAEAAAFPEEPDNVSKRQAGDDAGNGSTGISTESEMGNHEGEQPNDAESATAIEGNLQEVRLPEPGTEPENESHDREDHVLEEQAKPQPSGLLGDVIMQVLDPGNT
jgi:hypothetical protein